MWHTAAMKSYRAVEGRQLYLTMASNKRRDSCDRIYEKALVTRNVVFSSDGYHIVVLNLLFTLKLSLQYKVLENKLRYTVTADVAEWCFRSNTLWHFLDNTAISTQDSQFGQWFDITVLPTNVLVNENLETSENWSIYFTSKTKIKFI